MISSGVMAEIAAVESITVSVVMDLAAKPKPSVKGGGRALEAREESSVRAGGPFAAEEAVSTALGAVAEVVTADEHREEVVVQHFDRDS
jgi:hypothetical protein